jgi:hypothetical protein
MQFIGSGNESLYKSIMLWIQNMRQNMFINDQPTHYYYYYYYYYYY